MSGFNDFKPTAGIADAADESPTPSSLLHSRDTIEQAVAHAHALRAAAIRRAAAQLMQTVSSLWRRPRKIPYVLRRSEFPA
jgi:hypothetical protein